MKSLRNIADFPGGLPLVADDVLEFHAARIMLLLRVCGRRGKIDGLTKLAKLDFFVRYPSFFRRACAAIGKESDLAVESAVAPEIVESHMVRYHYGPWDRRYYQLLSYLEAKDLVAIEKVDRTYAFILTDQGVKVASNLQEQEPFYELVRHMQAVKRVFGNRKGSSLKALVYQVFDAEVAQRAIGEVIRSDD